MVSKRLLFLIQAIIEVKYIVKVSVTLKGGIVDEKINFGQACNSDSDNLDAVRLFMEYRRRSRSGSAGSTWSARSTWSAGSTGSTRSTGSTGSAWR
jgi:hypothetical protein